MKNLRALDNTPIATYLTALGFEVVLLVGGVVAIVNPDALSVSDYLTAVAISAIPVGLVGVGRGIQDYGRQRAGAEALRIAHEQGHTYTEPRPVDPEADMPDPAITTTEPS